MKDRPGHAREDIPYIMKGDSVFIERGGPSGAWEVMQAKYKSETGAEIELVLRRGSQMFKTVFNEATMRLNTERPFAETCRDIRAPEAASFRKKI